MLLWPWVLGYLAMDAAYVAASRGTYMERVAAIAGSVPKNVAKVLVCAAGAYALMAVGWACIVVPMVRTVRTVRMVSKRGGALAAAKVGALYGAKVGALYGAVLYGVFNFTVGAMFDGWTYAIMARDVAWGTASVAAYTALFAHFA